MRYQYSPPVAEKHEVHWYHGARPGIYDPTPRRTFGSLSLCDELVAWLDANAPGWSFRSDWDYSNAGDDDEGCHLTVSSSEEAHGFLSLANGISDRWVEADRASMRYRFVVESDADGVIEIQRGHGVPDYHHERVLSRYIELGRQPMRADAYRAMRDAVSEAHDRKGEESFRIEAKLKPEQMLVTGVRIAVVKVAAEGAA